jgi:hypothetical protein
MMNLTHVVIDDWAVIYENGERVMQGHSFSIAQLAVITKGELLTLKHINACGSKLEAWAHDHGELPDTLAKAQVMLA